VLCVLLIMSPTQKGGGRNLRRRIEQQSLQQQQQQQMQQQHMQIQMQQHHSTPTSDNDSDGDNDTVVSLLTGTIVFDDNDHVKRQRQEQQEDLEEPPTSSSTSKSSSSSPSFSSSELTTTTTRRRRLRLGRLSTIVFVLVHVVSVGMYIYGFVVRTKHLHTGEECDMTYSYREFIPIGIIDINAKGGGGGDGIGAENENGHDDSDNNVDNDDDDDGDFFFNYYYRLYKFVDRRDLRYTNLLKEVGILRNNRLSKDGSWKDLPALNSSKNTTNHCVWYDDLHDRVLHEEETTTTTTTTSATTTVRRPVHVVLYIPGHWGSYSQARSIGAHGIQLTGASVPYSQIQNIQQSLMTGTWNGLGGIDINDNTTTTATATGVGSIDNFAFEVYAVDFHEQGGALHGEFLLKQSQFVARAVTQLIDDCFFSGGGGGHHHNGSDGSSSSSMPPPTITLVGHSMGGYVARLTHLLHPDVRPFIRNIVTLATPHMNPLYAFDKSIYDIHRQMMTMTTSMSSSSDDLPTVVAISGGVRDEMIAPTACQLFDTKHPAQFISVLATHLMNPTSPTSSSKLGMDHRAIAWCHQVLDDVRNVIWAMVSSSSSSTTTTTVTNTATERLERIRTALKLENTHVDSSGSKKGYNDNNFVRDEATMRTALRRKFGQLTAVCMEASMLYNLPYLLGLFLVICGLQFSSIPSFQAILVTMSVGVIFSDVAVPWTATILLTFVANAVNILLTVGFRYVSRLFRSRQGSSLQPIKFIRNVMLVALVLILLSSYVVSKFLPPNRLHKQFFQWDVLIYAYSILVTILILLVGIQYQSCTVGATTKLHYFAMALLTLPVALAGSVTLIAWEHTTRRSSWETLLLVASPLNVWSILNIFSGDRLRREPSSASSTRLRVRSILVSCCTLGTCPWILSRGHGFIAPYLMACLGWIDIIFDLSNRLQSPQPKKRSE